MAIAARGAAALLAVCAWMAPATVAGATPAAGSESPADTIRDLTNEGYAVHINWVAGTPSNIPLSQCTVTSIDTSAPPAAYVSINCPPDGSQ
ncbi:hypothetical protein ACQI4F_10185 [Mycolicibacterium vaccae]|uniref:hypothetical protein n=1 Tax=Mycolicibacterium vaccae TaxID=1810 RepID=UPI003CF7A4A1